MRAWAYVLVVLALLAIGASLGVAWSARHASGELTRLQQQLGTAHATATLCQGNLLAASGDVDALTRQSADRLKQLQTMRAAATLALDQRDAARDALRKQTDARTRALRKVTHETPDCQPLAAMPLCPAVADRLWGHVAADDTHPD